MNNQSILLHESEGFSNRTSGETYYDPKNPDVSVVFQQLILLPHAPTQAYDTNQDLQESYENWRIQSENEGNEVFEINPASKTKNSTRAAVIVSMQVSDGASSGSQMFVRWTQKNTAKFSNIPATVTPQIPGFGGYKLNTAVARCSAAPIKPSDVLKGKSGQFFTPREIPELLDQAMGKGHDEVVEQIQGYLRAMATGNGKNYRITGGAKYINLHQKYTGEWAAPISLATGQIDPSKIKELQTEMLANQNIKKSKIQYSTSSITQLFDSEILVNGYTIKISSKAHKGGGASASLEGLHKTILSPVLPFEPEFWQDEKNEQFKKIVDIIVNNSAEQGVLKLAESANLPGNKAIITQGDSENIEKLINQGKRGIVLDIQQTDEETKKFSPNLQRLVEDFKIRSGSRGTYNLGYHAIAAVAKSLCDILNEEDFTSVAKAVLNNSNVVQMNFDAVKQGEDVVCQAFKLIWPARFTGWVKFNSSKNFYTTGIKGKINFKITPNKNERDEPDGAEIAPSSAEDEIEQIKQKRQEELLVGKIVKPGQRDVRDTTVPDVVALGRKRKTKQD